MRFSFAIIGGGLTATAMLCQLVDRMQEKAKKGQLDPSTVTVQIYEKQDTFGPGFPHSDRFVLPFHITNMCASDMGIFYKNPGDFEDWVTNNSKTLRSHFPWFPHPSSSPDSDRKECNHYPRAIMGEYLKARFQEAVQSARKMGLAVSLYPGSEVVDLRQNGGNICLSVKHLSSKSYFSSDADLSLIHI